MAVDALSHGTTATAFGFGLWLGSGLVPHVTRVALIVFRPGQPYARTTPRRPRRDERRRRSRRGAGLGIGGCRRARMRAA